jgi:hypothetical protein
MRFEVLLYVLLGALIVPFVVFHVVMIRRGLALSREAKLQPEQRPKGAKLLRLLVPFLILGVVLAVLGAVTVQTQHVVVGVLLLVGSGWLLWRDRRN